MSEEKKPQFRNFDAADALRAMADKCEMNSSEFFGGVVVIVPPEPGKSVEFLMLDSSKDIAMFWSNIKVKAEMAIQEADALARQNAAYGMR